MRAVEKAPVVPEHELIPGAKQIYLVRHEANDKATARSINSTIKSWVVNDEYPEWVTSSLRQNYRHLFKIGWLDGARLILPWVEGETLGGAHRRERDYLRMEGLSHQLLAQAQSPGRGKVCWAVQCAIAWMYPQQAVASLKYLVIQQDALVDAKPKSIQIMKNEVLERVVAAVRSL